MLEDGQAHVVDSSELAFRSAAIGAFREAFPKAKPVILEPVMTVEIVAPIEFQGSVIGAINQRKGTIVDTEIRDDEFTLTSEVALNDMFGYAGQLRGLTQGKGRSYVIHLRSDRCLPLRRETGEFSMEYKRHAPVLPFVQKDMVDAFRKKQLPRL